jgi:hypothetical protein
MQGFDYPVLAVCALHGPIGHGMGGCCRQKVHTGSKSPAGARGFF